MSAATCTTLCSFTNKFYDTTYIITINGDAGSYILTDKDGEAVEFSSFMEAHTALDATGEYGEVDRVEYQETVDLETGW